MPESLESPVKADNLRAIAAKLTQLADSDTQRDLDKANQQFRREQERNGELEDEIAQLKADKATVNVAIIVPVDNKKNAFFGVPFEIII